MKKIYWGSYTQEEIKELIKKSPVVLLPVGAYEQHGSHLTLDTDTDIGVEIVRATIERSNSPCVMLPPIWLGISEHHMKFTGTLTLKQTTLTEVIYDILESLNRNGVKKVVLVNSHGGNIGPLSAAMNMIGSKIDGQHILVTYWNLVSDIVKEIRLSEFGGISHAGELETSLKLYLSPKDVRKNLMTENIVKGNDYWSPEMFASNKVTLYKSFEKMSQLGHVGDPTKASIRTGEIVFNAIVTEMIKLVQCIHDGGFEDENC